MEQYTLRAPKSQIILVGRDTDKGYNAVQEDAHQIIPKVWTPIHQIRIHVIQGKWT